MSKTAKKASKKEAIERERQCLEWLRDGWTASMIVREASVKWGISQRQVEDYYARARDFIVSKFEKEKHKYAADIVSKLDFIYNKAMFEGEPVYNKKGILVYYASDMNVAKGALMDKAKLSGLLKDQVEFTDVKAPDLSQVPKKELLEKLRRKPD